MYGTKLCLSASDSFKIPLKERIKFIKEAGFEAFFADWDRQTDWKDIKRYADSLKIEIQSIHAPFVKAADMWIAGEAAEAAVGELLDCIADCAEIGVPIIVCHAIIGFDKFEPNDIGIVNYGRVVDAAAKANIKIAFENTEGEMYLEKLMNAFKDKENVGFCWDSGHEQCYNGGKDMLDKYGDRLIATHLNDNLGVSDFDGKVTWTDDLHLLPFDGIIDWREAADKLKRCGYDGILTFELLKYGKPGRHENDLYSKMSVEEYIAQCYIRACRFAHMKNK